MLDPLIVSWGWQARTPGASPSQDYFEWIGTDDPSAYLSVPAAIEFQERYDWAQVRLAAHRLASEARRRIAELTGLPPICPDTLEWYGQMAAAPLPIAEGITSETLKNRLWDEHGVEVPISDWQGRRRVREWVWPLGPPPAALAALVDRSPASRPGALLDHVAHSLPLPAPT